MSRIDVLCKVTIYEVDGEESSGSTFPQLLVESHWNRDEMVILTLGKKKVTVLGTDLAAAIRNATGNP